MNAREVRLMKGVLRITDISGIVLSSGIVHFSDNAI